MTAALNVLPPHVMSAGWTGAPASVHEVASEVSAIAASSSPMTQVAPAGRVSTRAVPSPVTLRVPSATFVASSAPVAQT